jgi:hypothetical protein
MTNSIFVTCCGRRWSNSFALRDLFDHLVGDGEQLWRDLDAKRPRRLQVDDGLELGHERYRKVGRLFALEDAADTQ